MKRRRVRADRLLVAQGRCASAAGARALILAGRVYRQDRRITKAGLLLPDDAELQVRQPAHAWASRGGIKLAHALDHFGLNPAGTVALDIGASTGGFTDVLLQRGARRVYAVDVGYGQLAWRLRTDPRTVVLERTNARYLDSGQIPEPVDFVVCDASFIGLSKVLPAPLALAGAGAHLVALVKPQFEVGRAEVGKGGIVRDPAARARAVAGVLEFLSGEPGWHPLGQVESPVPGARGNVETLVAAVRMLRT